MSHPARIVILSALLVLAACTAETADTLDTVETPEPAGGPLSAEDLASVEAVWDAITAADEQADWDASESLMTEDFVHLDPRTPPILGRAAWRDWVDGMQFGIAELAYETHEIAGSGDLAYVLWAFAGAWTEAGETMEGSGKGISIFKKQADGSWLLARNAWNENP